MALSREVVITSALRTPVGAFNGSLAEVAAPALASEVIKALIRRTSVPADKIDSVILGNVLPGGLGQAPARQAALGAGISHTTSAFTVNKVCGSGLMAVILGANQVMLGDADIVIAGGMENMSRSPYLLTSARSGYRMGNSTLVDSMIMDGLWDPYNDFHMGSAAEMTAQKYGISREDVDAYAVMSYARAVAAQSSGRFEREIIPVSLPSEQTVSRDEEPGRGRPDAFAALKPAFKKDGIITVANSSSLSDGAAAVMIMTGQRAKELGLPPLVRICSNGVHGEEPAWFPIAPVGAVQKVLKKEGIGVENVDLFEINEAFAVVTIAVNRLLGIISEKVNVNGGAVALGHPIGASGARILVTLIHALIDRKKTSGIASLCIGGGEGIALMVERV